MDSVGKQALELNLQSTKSVSVPLGVNGLKTALDAAVPIRRDDIIKPLELRNRLGFVRAVQFEMIPQQSGEFVGRPVEANTSFNLNIRQRSGTIVEESPVSTRKPAPVIVISKIYPVHNEVIRDDEQLMWAVNSTVEHGLNELLDYLIALKSMSDTVFKGWANITGTSLGNSHNIFAATADNINGLAALTPYPEVTAIVASTGAYNQLYKAMVEQGVMPSQDGMPLVVKNIPVYQSLHAPTDTMFFYSPITYTVGVDGDVMVDIAEGGKYFTQNVSAIRCSIRVASLFYHIPLNRQKFTATNTATGEFKGGGIV